MEGALARAFLECRETLNCARSRALVPFVRLWYGQASTYYWWDASGARRSIRQGEGCEQGDALAPALCALGQRDALVVADQRLQRTW